MSHTPGPWIVDVEYQRGPRGGRGRRGTKTMLMVVAEKGGMPGLIVNIPPVVNETDEANARLIAAAPDLLAALQRTAHALELAFSRKPLRDMQETLAEANAAISKAEGK